MSMKSKITMFAIIMYISLVCVGFASWTFSISTKDISTDNSVISAETIINTSDEITLGDVTTFKYFNNGFIDNDNKLSYVTTLEIDLTIDKSSCAEVTAELKINELITGLKFDNISCTISGSSDTTTYGTKVTIDTTKLSSNEITLVYTLTANKETFIQNIFNPLFNNQDKNIFSIELNVTKENIEE